MTIREAADLVQGEQLDLVSMIGEEIAIPCDGNDCDRAASWIVWANHQCDEHAASGFLCDPCLQRVLTASYALKCPATGESFRPARTWLSRFERIDHKPTTTLPLSS